MDRREFLGAAAATLVTGLAQPAAGQAVKIKPGPQDVLLVVDVQNCFVPGGTLPVAGGDQIIPLINRLARAFEHVVITQD